MSKLSSILFVLVAFVILVSYVESANSESNEETDIMDMENGDDFEKRAPGWGKRAPGWGKRAPGWGKRAPGWGKRAPGWGKRAPGWGKRAPGWGKRSEAEKSALVECLMSPECLEYMLNSDAEDMEESKRNWNLQGEAGNKNMYY